MQFVNPFILFGLIAISIPIIVHLFKFRRFKKVYFTNVKFIEELKLETQRRSRLKHLLILLMRILAISFLVLAFAQPYIPVSSDKLHQGVSHAISIFVDNSFSMESMSENGHLYDEAKNRAKEIVSIYESSDVFQLITNDFEGRHQRFISKDEITELLTEVNTSPVARKLSEVNKRQQDILNTERKKVKSAYIISDFQKSITDIQNFTEDTSISTYLIPLKANIINNLFIDSCWFESPSKHIQQQVKLIVRVKNVSDMPYEKIPVKLLINRMQKSVASFDIDAYGQADITMPFTNTTTGIQYGELHIIDYPVVYDDIFYFSYEVSDAIPLLCINNDGESRYLNSLFSTDSSFVFVNTSIKQIDYSAFNNFRLIILNELNEISSGLSQELKRYVESSGNLLVIPSKDINIENYNEFLLSLEIDVYNKLDTINTKVSYVDIKHPVFREVFDDIAAEKGSLPKNTDLPLVSNYYQINQISTSRQDILMSMQNGQPFLSHFSAGRGSVYLLAVPLQEEFSNFPRHAIFVPALYNIALLSDVMGKLYFTIGEDESIEFKQAPLTGDQVFRIKRLNSEFEIIPEHKYFNSLMYFYPHGQLNEAGSYVLLNDLDSIGGVSINYDRTESNLEVFSPEDINRRIDDVGLRKVTVLELSDKPISQAISEISQGKRLWKLFIFLALFMLAGEVVLLRFWK